MSGHLRILTFSLACTCWLPPCVFAQQGGSRAGQDGYDAGLADLPPLEREVAQSYIAIEGRAEMRVQPTEIRIVLAVTSEGNTAGQCRHAIDGAVERLTAAWSQIGIAVEDVVIDFIAVLPRYEWKLEQQSGIDVGVETRVGYRMQTNVHLAVPSDARADEALDVAFEQGVTDIIAFDYWSDELNEIRTQVRGEAIEAARTKADTLLGAIFDERPPAINVQENTTVHFPETLYHSFTNAYAENVTPSWRRDVPFIRDYRPQNTYYRGLNSEADRGPRELPMSPQISVVSTVRIYFESPAANRVNEGNNHSKE